MAKQVCNVNFFGADKERAIALGFTDIHVDVVEFGWFSAGIDLKA